MRTRGVAPAEGDFKMAKLREKVYFANKDSKRGVTAQVEDGEGGAVLESGHPPRGEEVSWEEGHSNSRERSKRIEEVNEVGDGSARRS